MARLLGKTWTLKEIESAIEVARDRTACPQCDLEFKPQKLARIGEWRLAVGADDVSVAVRVTCSRAGHTFLLITSLWHKAVTPSRGLRVKKKIAPRWPAAPRPLAGI